MQCATNLLVCMMVLFSPIVSRHYDIDPNAVRQNDSEQNCRKYEEHLASVHTESQIEEIKNICIDTCWIGLSINFNKSNNDTILEWSDQSEIDQLFINQYWCKGYPLIHYNYSSNVYSVYVDNINNCWKSVIHSSSIKMEGICGPTMFDITGYFWICNTIFPALLTLFAFIYSIYCFGFLLYHLCIFEHNWIHNKLEPTKAIKVTAILLPVTMSIIAILCFSYVIIVYVAHNQTGIIYPYTYFDTRYPYIYYQLGVILYLTILLLLIYQPITYIHTLLRLKHVFDNNSIMKPYLTSSYCSWYRIVICLIILYSTLPIIYLSVRWLTFTESKTKWTSNTIGLSVYILLHMAINSILLFLYLKGLHKYSHEQYFRINDAKQNMHSPLIDPRQHELMIEAARYTVLFSIVLICNIMGLLVVSITYIILIKYYWYNKSGNMIFKYIVTDILALYWFGKELLLLIAIQLSFKFSHIKYEKLCSICDKKMKQYCHTIVKRKNSDIVQEYELKTAQQRMLRAPLL